MGNAAVLSWQHIGRHLHPFDQFTGSIRRRPHQDLAGLFGVLQLLRPRVSGGCLGIWKLIPCGISTLMALRRAIIITQYLDFRRHDT